MDRKKVIYIGLILILTVIVSITYFSYAFFTSKAEQRGKLNIITGTLNYEIKSDDLVNNAITLGAGELKQIEVELTSLNTISSKYELFYETTNDQVKVGYSGDTVPFGTINAKDSITVIINLKNYSTSSNATVTFSIEGGFISNTLVKSKGITIPTSSSLCRYTANQVFSFTYNGTNGSDGSIQEFDTDFCTGTYKLEVWGAQGGSTYSTGGLGGYSIGEINLSESKNLFIAVGGQPSSYATGGYNGGGNGAISTSAQFYKSSGGGATHITLNNNRGVLANYVNNKNDILIVAGGGGGGAIYPNNGPSLVGGTGGGLTSGYLRYYYNGSSYQSRNAGANQTGTYTNLDTFNFPCGANHTVTTPVMSPGSFGQGTGGTQYSGGGGGYYGGASYGECSLVYSGGGGSGYIGELTNATSTAGQRSGHGYARITYLGD